MSTLKLYGDNTSYQQIINEILRVKGVITHGLFLNAIKAAVVATGPEAKIIEKVNVTSLNGPGGCIICRRKVALMVCRAW